MFSIRGIDEIFNVVVFGNVVLASRHNYIHSTPGGCKTLLTDGTEHSMSIDELRLHYRVVKQISDFIIECAHLEGGPETDIEDGKEWGFNPLYNRVAANGGISLEMSDGLPVIIETPLGAWTIMHVSSYPADFPKRLFERIKVRLGLSLLEGERDIYGRFGGQFGPVYQINKKLNGESLPTPIRFPPGNAGGMAEGEWGISIPATAYAAEQALWLEVRPDVR